MLGAGSMSVRAVIDGSEVAEPDEVIFAMGTSLQSRTMTFAFSGVKAGWRRVKFQWLSEGGAGIMGDRTMVFESLPTGNQNEVIIPEHTGYIVTSNTEYEPIPGLNDFMSIPANAEICVRFSAESIVTDNEQLFVRLRVGGEVIEESEVVFKGSRDVKDIVPMKLIYD